VVLDYIIDTDTENGLKYIETSYNWKSVCSTLPCFAEMWWPDYVTKVIKTTISGHPVVIQLWKGWCQRFGGRWANFPGGMGAEVGIYRKVAEGEPGSNRYLFQKPATKIDQGLHQFRDGLSKVPQKVTPLKAITPLLPRHDRPHGNSEGEVWYPYPELKTRLWFMLVDPWTGEEFFQTNTEPTYWLTRWMAPDSYRHSYQNKHLTPPFAADYKLYYKINGAPQEPW
jgi:hypothetical protein